MSHSLAYCPTVKSLKQAGFTTRTMPRHTHTTEMPEHSELCSGISHTSGPQQLCCFDPSFFGCLKDKSSVILISRGGGI